MPGFAASDVIGYVPMTSFYQLDTVPGGDGTSQITSPQGQILMGQDPWWGGGEFLRCRANGTIRQFGLVVVSPTFNTAAPAFGQYEYLVTEAPATANLGRALGVAMRNATAGQYVWVQVGGVTPVNCNASVAADTTFGIAAAGQGGANVAGRQVLNARVVAAGTTTVVKAACRAPSASTILEVPNADGWFPGVFLSGTGIAAATQAVQIDINNRTVTLNNATTAAVNGNVTATYNNGTIHYNVAYLNRPFAQGAIT